MQLTGEESKLYPVPIKNGVETILKRSKTEMITV